MCKCGMITCRNFYPPRLSFARRPAPFAAHWEGKNQLLKEYWGNGVYIVYIFAPGNFLSVFTFKYQL